MRMLVLGDSVNWGQGLLPQQKFHNLVFARLNAPPSAESECVLLAHSGATIGARTPTPQPAADGEVPKSYPTILQQCKAFTQSPDSVDVVLVNGGINDVDIRTILDPFTETTDLKDMTVQYCYHDMITLLNAVTAHFPNPATTIVLTGYYPILSSQSDLILLPKFLNIHGVLVDTAFTALSGLLFGKIINNCSLFWQQSSTLLARAASEVKTASGRRIFYADAPFTAANAAMAPQAWLWGVNPDLSAEDPVRDSRHASCDLHETDPILRQTCYRASAGHPNVEGARQFAQTILSLPKPAPPAPAPV